MIVQGNLITCLTNVPLSHSSYLYLKPNCLFFFWGGVTFHFPGQIFQKYGPFEQDFNPLFNPKVGRVGRCGRNLEPFGCHFFTRESVRAPWLMIEVDVHVVQKTWSLWNLLFHECTLKSKMLCQPVRESGTWPACQLRLIGIYPSILAHDAKFQRGRKLTLMCTDILQSAAQFGEIFLVVIPQAGSPWNNELCLRLTESLHVCM